MTPVDPWAAGDSELLAEAYRVVEEAVTLAGAAPGVATAAWWAAPDNAKRAGLLVLAEGWLIHDPDRAVRERLRRMSWDLSAAHDWTAASRRPSHRELIRRRGVVAS